MRRHTVQNNQGDMFCNVWYVKVNVVDEVPMVVQHTLRPQLLRVRQIEVILTCRRSHALNGQMIPQNKDNIGPYVSRCEVHRLLWSFEHIVRKPVHPMRHLNEVQVARAVTDPGMAEFSSCYCGSQCLSVSYSPLVESLR